MRLKLFKGFWQFLVLSQKSHLHIAVVDMILSIYITEGFTFQNHHYGTEVDVFAVTHSLVISDVHCLMWSPGLCSRLRKTQRSSLVTVFPLRFENESRTVNDALEIGCFDAGSRNNCPSAQMNEI